MTERKPIKSAREEYGDIIDHEHHTSSKHPRMSRLNRAAQFAPFAALVGYDDLVMEAARNTDEQVEIDESMKEELDRKLRLLLHLGKDVTASITYFEPDHLKLGGKYVTEETSVLAFDELSRTVTLGSGTVINVEQVYSIEFAL